MTILLTTLLPALLPVVGDGLRGLFSKFTNNASADPQNVDEKIQLMEADVAKLRALADLGKPSGNASQWVTDLRESSRYIAVIAVLSNAAFQSAYNDDQAIVLLSLELASSAFFFLFGDRVYVHLRRK